MTDSEFQRLTVGLNTLRDLLIKQEQALICRDPEQLTELSEKCLEINDEITRHLTSVDIAAWQQTEQWKETVNLLQTCREQYQRNQQHLDDMSVYCQRLSRILLPNPEKRYSQTGLGSKKKISLSGSLGRA
ncbi:hypothetical protein M3P05_06275 [Sansalvadorimonas sp. 2012CJ34-2]|uniref:Flagellar biosynthesis protein FlgN n=1 Tax=Parendozoicomonas callyspongiae TaxID=2942213 RepID=A0ABT0PEX1_9GAMM|nr:hypothetical protein [Sansalvadorimonas sp. 2012CJ34-2]MCL6269546.1 hypothetical protein [Sansalvadorimonas sp. 2012CJ34-2]